MDSLEGYVSDDELAIEPLNRLGWDVETISWRDRNVDWNRYDSVVLRTTWDYQHDPVEFLKVLLVIEASSARLENSLSIIEWNLDKSYLGDLEQKGIAIVPTLWSENGFTETEFDAWLAAFETDRLIVKPTVSATAQDTFPMGEFDERIAAVFDGRSFMVQPFVPAVVSEGEYSLFYFNGLYSHTILKTPKHGDFRVQEEHGGIITAVEPDTGMLRTAGRIASKIEPSPLYARIDLVRHGAEWLLMELELIEPALYFRMDPRSPILFAREFDRRMNEL